MSIQPPTSGAIHPRGQHLASKSVDHVPDWNDLNLYATEDATVGYIGQAGTPGTTNDAGLVVQFRGKTGLHQFGHCEKFYVKTGDKVKRGTRLAKMGYTGYTIPSGAGGRHLHYWVKTPSGFVYPPTIYTLPMIKGGTEMLTRHMVRMLFLGFLNVEPTKRRYDIWTGKDPKRLIDALTKNKQHIELKKRAKAYTSLKQNNINKDKQIKVLNQQLAQAQSATQNIENSFAGAEEAKRQGKIEVSETIINVMTKYKESL